MPETLAIPETVSLPSKAILEACAELEAVETMLARLWGHQDGGEGNIADRIGQAISTLLFEAFGDEAYESMIALSEERAEPILETWAHALGKRRAEDAARVLQGHDRDPAQRLRVIEGGRDDVGRNR